MSANSEERQFIENESSFRQAWISVERLSILLGLLAMAFAAGMNWHRLDGLDVTVATVQKKQDAQDDMVKREYARKDVIAGELSNINYQLSELRMQLLKEQSANPTPRFGR